MSPSKSEDNLKVTDRRMFTPDGELREEYRFLEQGEQDAPVKAAPVEEQPTPSSADSIPVTPEPMTLNPAISNPPTSSPAAIDPGAAGPPLEQSGASQAAEAPGFFDLVGMLAEPASIYMGDVPLPDGRVEEDLEMARLHIDLLDMLRHKTAGNLSSRESAVLEDVLYQLNMRYERKQG